MEKVTEVWPVWEFDCPKCGESNQLSDGDFGYHDEIEYGEAAECCCQGCDNYFLVIKPE